MIGLENVTEALEKRGIVTNSYIKDGELVLVGHWGDLSDRLVRWLRESATQIYTEI